MTRVCHWCPFQTTELDEMYRHSVREHGDELWHEEADRCPVAECGGQARHDCPTSVGVLRLCGHHEGLLWKNGTVWVQGQRVTVDRSELIGRTRG